MPTEILAPRLNANDDEVEVAFWHVKNRASIKKGAPVVDLGSSKAVVTVSSDVAGTVKLLRKVGARVRIGAALARVYADLAELEADKREVDEAPSPGRGRKAAPRPHASAAKRPAPQLAREEAVLVPPASFGTTRLSSAARAYVEENGLDIAKWGGRGLVTLPALLAMLGSSEPSSAPAVEEDHDGAPELGLRSEPVNRVKQLEIATLTAGQAGNVVSSLTIELGAEPIVRMLKRQAALNAQLLPLVLYEIAKLLEEHAAFTAFYRDGSIYYWDRVHLGVAVDFGKGLKVVTIRDANELLPSDIQVALTEHALRYTRDELTTEDLTGSTVTVTDLSGEGIRHFRPLLNRDQSIIFGIGGDAAEPGHPMSITASFDHRVLGGREVARFLSELRRRLVAYGQDLPVDAG